MPISAAYPYTLTNGTTADATQVMADFSQIQSDVNTYAAPLASPTFTGTPAAPTAVAGTNTTQLATTAFVTAAVTAAAFAPLNSPAFTGTPTAPTAAPGTNTTQLATTAFVAAAAALLATLASPALTGTPTAPTAAIGTNTTQIATTAFAQTLAAVVGATRNLVVKQSTVTRLIVTADEIMVETALGGAVSKVASLNVTLDVTTTGANGMDIGTPSASSDLHIYAIRGAGQSNAVLATISGSGASIYPGANMPSGYTMSALISSIKMNSSGQFNYTYQIDRSIRFVKINAVNITSSVPTSFTSLVISSIVPANAKSVSGVTGTPNVVTGGGIFASDANGTGYQGGYNTPSTQPLVIDGFESITQIIDLALSTAQTVYYKGVDTGNPVRFDIFEYKI